MGVLGTDFHRMRRLGGDELRSARVGHERQAVDERHVRVDGHVVELEVPGGVGERRDERIARELRAALGARRAVVNRRER